MKRLFLILFLTVLMFVCSQKDLHAAVYTLMPHPKDLYDLEHSKAYSWGIRRHLQADEIITHATLRFRHINNWRVEPNKLFVRLFQNCPRGVNVFDDNEPGMKDYFRPRGIRLFTYIDDDAAWEHYTYHFSNFEIGKLNKAIQNGNFGLGFDPDCHYYNRAIKLRFCTKVVPEPTTMMLFTTGLLGLIGYKKRLRERR